MADQQRKTIKKGSLHSANHQCFVILLAPLDSCETNVAILSCESASKACDVPSHWITTQILTQPRHAMGMKPEAVIESGSERGFCPGVQGSPMAPNVSASFSGTGILLIMMKPSLELASEHHDKTSFA